MSFSLKLDRAREHLDSFEVEIGAWLITEPYGIVDEPDPEPPPQPVPDGYRPRRFRIVRSAGVPARLSLLIRDCLFNLRAALDHLAFALAFANTPGMLESQISSSEFPIFRNLMDSKAEQRKIGCIAPAACDAIKALQ